MHREHLKEYKPMMFNDLVLVGRLWVYLADLNEHAQSRLQFIIRQMHEMENVTDDFSGVKLSVYDRERTICDCFKYRSRLDHEIFNKALNAYAKDEKKNLQNLSIYAKKLRVHRKVIEVMSVLLED